MIKIGKLLTHRKRGRGIQFLAIPKDAQQYKAELQQLWDFVDADGTIAAVL